MDNSGVQERRGFYRLFGSRSSLMRKPVPNSRFRVQDARFKDPPL